MARTVHLFDRPARFVAGTVGLPGERVFYLQARDGARMVSVALEKEQVRELATRLGELLDHVAAEAGVDSALVGPADLDPLDSPVEEEFRALLVRTYASSLSAFRDQKFDFRPLRMAKKIEAGAEFFQTQYCFDFGVLL